MKTYTRTLLLFLLSAAAIFPVSAQWRFGIQGGYTYSTLTTKTRYFYDWNYVGRGGYAIGFPVQYEFFDWLAVQAELSWIQKNYRLERSPYYGFYENRTNYYLSVPVFARFSFGGRKIRGFLNAGGYAGGWLASQRQGIEFTQFGTNQGAGTGSAYYQYDENTQLPLNIWITPNGSSIGTGYFTGQWQFTDTGIPQTIELASPYMMMITAEMSATGSPGYSAFGAFANITLTRE